MAKSSNLFQVAVVGGETLLGRELMEVIGSRGGTAVSYAASGEGNFGEAEGEAVYIEALSLERVASDRAIVLAGSKEGAAKAYDIVKIAGGKPALLDSTGQLEDQPEARLVAPLVEEVQRPAGWLLVIAHPAASALALVLSRLRKLRALRQAVVHVFEPASERGQRGLNELHQQTTGLLAFKPLDKDVFDEQLSFNLLARYGEEAPLSLSEVEAKIERHLATILSRLGQNRFPMPSIRVIQAPVFHGYSLSLWVEFDGDVTAQAIEEALASAQIEVRSADEEPPTGVGATGQSGLLAGDIRLDANHRRAAWIWIAADNLRLVADSAAELIASLGRDTP